MKSVRNITAIIVLLLFAIGVQAQPPRINVHGYVINSADPNESTVAGVDVYGYSTMAAAQDAYESIVEFFRTGLPPELGLNVATTTDPTGYYELMVPTTGAIVFFSLNAKAPVLKSVNGKEELTVKMMINSLDAATVTGAMDGPSAETEAELEGNNWNLNHTVTVPAAYGKTNARLIFQPFVLAGNEIDTLEFRKPIIFDGPEYRLTQQRRLGFDPDADPLFNFYVDSLTADEFKIVWKDTIYLEDPTIVRHAKSITRIEDYTSIYYEKEDHINSTDKIRRPLKFLDYNVQTYSLKHEDYYVPPRKEKMPGSEQLSITFVTGEATIDPSDTFSLNQLEGLKRKFHEIMNAEGSQLTEMGVMATASPDGSYAKNVDLARRRLNYAFNEIWSSIPRDKRPYIINWKESRVATWEEVADAMHKDGFVTEADEIRSIANEFKGNMDAQFAKIKTLSYYREPQTPGGPTVIEYCAKLKSMTCEYESVVYRALTPEEILANYNDESKGYKSGKTPLSLNEFWNLFKMVTDDDEREHLYKLAYQQSRKTTGKPWVLAANNLAEMYFEKGIVDTTLLYPFIDLRYNRADYVLRNPDAFGNITEEVMNPREIVANQLVMYLKDNNFRSASIMAQLLPDEEEFKMMKAFTRVLGGHYKGGKTPEEKAERRKNFELARDSSPRNAVVMNLALSYDQFAEEALELLPDDDQLKAYFRVAIETRRNGEIFADMMLEMEMIDLLKSAFYKDPTLIDIARADPDINETVFKYAYEDYKNGY